MQELHSIGRAYKDWTSPGFSSFREEQIHRIKKHATWSLQSKPLTQVKQDTNQSVQPGVLCPACSEIVMTLRNSGEKYTAGPNHPALWFSITPMVKYWYWLAWAVTFVLSWKLGPLAIFKMGDQAFALNHLVKMMYGCIYKHRSEISSAYWALRLSVFPPSERLGIISISPGQMKMRHDRSDVATPRCLRPETQHVLY